MRIRIQIYQIKNNFEEFSCSWKKTKIAQKYLKNHEASKNFHNFFHEITFITNFLAIVSYFSIFPPGSEN